jgi:hypothetical protein
MIPLSTLRPFIPSLATTTSDMATRSSMGMADRISSGVPYISTSSLAHGVTHFYSSAMVSIVAWFRATMSFPVKKKQKGNPPVRGAPFCIRSILPERFKY